MTRPERGDTVLYHEEQTGDWIEATVREMAPLPVSQSFLVRVSAPGWFHDRWVPLRRLDYDGKDAA